MKAVAIVQARMSSTRLPGKVLKTVLGKPLLQFQLERLRRCREVDDIVIATSTNPSDDPIVELCRRLRVPCSRGPEQDVLARVHGAATSHRADTVVRVNSDCPLIDPGVVDRVIRAYRDQADRLDYVSNIAVPSYPVGMHTEVFSYRVLEIINREATDPQEREHVTPYIYRNPTRFRLLNVAFERDESHHRWTLDQPEDFVLISRIIEALYPTNPAFGLQDTLELLKLHPDWPAVNGHILKRSTI